MHWQAFPYICPLLFVIPTCFGEISPLALFSNLINSLYSLALSNNSLSSTIPQCHKHLSETFLKYHATAHEHSSNTMQKHMQVIIWKWLISVIIACKGKLATANVCQTVRCFKGLAVSNNQLLVFPFLVEFPLSELKVFTVRHNEFHGEIVGKTKKGFETLSQVESDWFVLQ